MIAINSVECDALGEIKVWYENVNVLEEVGGVKWNNGAGFQREMKLVVENEVIIAQVSGHFSFDKKMTSHYMLLRNLSYFEAVALLRLWADLRLREVGLRVKRTLFDKFTLNKIDDIMEEHRNASVIGEYACAAQAYINGLKLLLKG